MSPRLPRALLAFAALIGASALVGCSDDSVLNPVPVPAPPPVDPATFGVSDAGPFTCGHRQLTTTYTPPGNQPPRTIPVHVWYPSTTTSGTHPTYSGIFPDEIAWDDGVPAPPAWPTGYPTLIHSHGYQGFAGNSATLMCAFAAHGWLAVAPDHVGNLLADTPPTLPLSIYYERPLDLRASLALVESLPNGDPLQGKADLGHLAMSGHSFGTYDAWAVAGALYDVPGITASCTSGSIADCDAAGLAVFSTDLSERRAKVVIPLAGGHASQFLSNGEDAARVPVLLMSGSLNPVGADTLFANVVGVDLTWVDVVGGCHQLFGLGNTQFPDPASCAVLPDAEGFALVNPFILAYARYHVLDDRGAVVAGLVEGTSGLSPLMNWHHRD
jgi:predicted dienelactone hydrolase